MVALTLQFLEGREKEWSEEKKEKSSGSSAPCWDRGLLPEPHPLFLEIGSLLIGGHVYELVSKLSSALFSIFGMCFYMLLEQVFSDMCE